MSSKEQLASFLKALDANSIMSFDKRRFNHRLKLQKYVFIARNFGFITPYNYSLYIHGPYSSNLADDYYHIGSYEDKEAAELDSRFVKLVKNKSEVWLELATTIIMIKERYENISYNKLIDLVKTTKPFARSDYLAEIIRDLKKQNCLD